MSFSQNNEETFVFMSDTFIRSLHVDSLKRKSRVPSHRTWNICICEMELVGAFVESADD